MLARNSSSSEHCISISTTAWATFYAREEEKVPGRRTRDVLQHRQSVQGRARGTAQVRAVEGPEQVSQTQWSRGEDSRPKEGLPHTITSVLLPREASRVQNDRFRAASSAGDT